MTAIGATEVVPAESPAEARSLRRDALLVAGLVAVATVFYLAPWPVLYAPALLALAYLTWLRLDLALLLVPLFVPYFMEPKHIGSHVFAPSEVFVVLDVVVAGMYAWQQGVGKRWGPAEEGGSRAAPTSADRDGATVPRASFVVSDRPARDRTAPERLAFPRVALTPRTAELRWERLRGSPFLLPAVLLLLGATLSTALAVDRHHALEWYRWTILEPVAFFGILVLVGSRRSWPWVFAGLLGAGVVTSLIGLWQFATHTDLTPIPGTTVERIHALYGSPDNLGLLLDRVLPVWLAVAVSSWLALRARIVWAALGVVMLAALYLTNSRGAWVAVILAFAVVLALSFPWGRYVLIAVVVLGLAAAVFEGPKLVNLYRSSQTNTVQRRIDIWKSSVRMARDHPIFGVGPDNFLHYYSPKAQTYIPCPHGLGYMEPQAWEEPCLSHPHDEILDFWLSTGIAGLVAFLWIEAVFWMNGFRLWRGGLSAPSWSRTLLVGSMAAMVASIVHGLVDNSYFLVDLATLFWLFCAFVSWSASRRCAAPSTRGEAAT